MDVPDYLEEEIILPSRCRGQPLWLRFFNEASLAEASRADIAAGIAADAAAELIFPEFPSLLGGHLF